MTDPSPPAAPVPPVGAVASEPPPPPPPPLSGGAGSASAGATPAAQGAPLQRAARLGWPAPPQWLLWLTLVLALAGLAWSFTLVQRIERGEQEMARRAADSLAEAVAARELAAAAEAQSKDLAARLGLAELRLSEVALQRSQLEELMLTVARTRDDSLVHDLEASVRFAQQQSQLSGSVQPLISALRGAEQRIARAAQPRLNPVQRAIAADIERLQAAQWVDVPALAQRLDGLARRVDQWPLLNQPLPSAMVYQPGRELTPVRTAPEAQVLEPMPQVPEAVPAPQAVAAAPEALSAAAPLESAPVAAAAAPVAAEAPVWARAWGWVGQTGSGALAWLWQQVRQSSADLVRISRIEQPEAALLAPEQAYFLRENIRLKLLSARLGLMARQFDAARADVQTVQTLVQRYFDPAAAETQRVLDTLVQLQIDMQQPELPRPDDTLAALQIAAGGR